MMAILAVEQSCTSFDSGRDLRRRRRERECGMFVAEIDDRVKRSAVVEITVETSREPQFSGIETRFSQGLSERLQGRDGRRD